MSTDVIHRAGFFITVPHDVVRGIKDGNALLVYSILLTYSTQGGQVHPKRETIAEHMGAKTTKPVDAALKKLADLGLVATFPRWRDEKWNSYARTPDETHKFQTSNGYILYAKIQPKFTGWDVPDLDVVPAPEGEGAPNGHPGGSRKGTAGPKVARGSRMDTRGVAKKVHEEEPVEEEPSFTNPQPQPQPQPQPHNPADLNPKNLPAIAGVSEPQPPAPEKKTGKRRDYTPEFETWFKLYPKRVGKTEAFMAWLAATHRDGAPSLADLNAHTIRYAQYVAVTGVGTRYIPYPATWLNQDRWQDELVFDASNDKLSRTQLNALAAQTGAAHSTPQQGALPW